MRRTCVNSNYTLKGDELIGVCSFVCGVRSLTVWGRMDCLGGVFMYNIGGELLKDWGGVSDGSMDMGAADCNIHTSREFWEVHVTELLVDMMEMQTEECYDESEVTGSFRRGGICTVGQLGYRLMGDTRCSQGGRFIDIAECGNEIVVRQHYWQTCQTVFIGLLGVTRDRTDRRVGE
ncbi:hypothetical protein Tco_1532991 [Tanacetum coccineum]